MNTENGSEPDMNTLLNADQAAPIQVRTKKLTCIRCPIGCFLDVTYTRDGIVTVEGNSCIRGNEYAETELMRPERIVTTTMRISDGPIILLPVKTSVPVARDKTAEVVREASRHSVRAPIRRGDVVVSNVAQTGADLVATRTVPVKQGEEK